MGQSVALLPRRSAALFSLPAGLLIALFLLFPALWVLAIALTDLTLTSVEPARFVGLRNFQRLLHDHFFWNALRVSLVFVLGSAVIGQAGLGLFLALLLRRLPGRLASLITAVAVCSWIVPEVVAACCWASYLDTDHGLVNQILRRAGLRPIAWLKDYALLSIIVFNTWRGMAFSVLLFSAALSAIPPSYLETAEVLGASAFRQFRDILLPLLRGHLLTNLLLITLWTFNLFTPFLLTRGGPSFQTELLPIFIYRVSFLGTFKLGLGSAAAVLMLLINLGLGLAWLLAGRKR